MTEAIHQSTFQISAPDADCFGRLKPSSILQMMQEAAEAQCQALALDWKSLAERHLFWAVTRQSVCIRRLPCTGETITIETWPGITTRVAYPRSCLAYDAQGNEVFRAMGLWVLMDLDSRAMVLPGKSGILVKGIRREQELAAPASIPPAVLSHTAVRQARYSELDCNGHLNNARYLDWMEDLLPAAFHRQHPLAAFTVCYFNEVREGQTVELGWNLDNGELRLEGRRQQEDGIFHRAFAIRAHYGA